MARRLPPPLSTLPLSVCPWRAFYPSPVRISMARRPPVISHSGWATVKLDAPSLPRKDNRFDQELPSIRGSKVWRKGSRPVAWLDGMVEILVSDNTSSSLQKIFCLFRGLSERTPPRSIPSFTVAQPLWEMTGGLLAMDIRTGEG